MAVAAPPSRCSPHRAAPRTAVLAALVGDSAADPCRVQSGPAQSDLAEAPGTVELNQAPPNDVPFGGGGTGTVFFHGKIYRFAIGGMGVDGSAVAIIQTSGEVYRLADIAQFPGTYRRAPSGSIAPGQPGGGLWLQNEHAVTMHLRIRLAAACRTSAAMACVSSWISDLRRSYCDMDMTTASPPRLSIRPVRLALRCMMTPASFCIHRSPPLVVPIAKP